MTKRKGPSLEEKQMRLQELTHRRDVLLELVHETQTELDSLRRALTPYQHFLQEETNAR